MDGDREALRRRLRERLHGKRERRLGGGGGGTSSSRASAQQKVEELMLHAFGDDPDALRTVANAVRDPRAALSALARTRDVEGGGSEDEEEAPPPPSVRG